MKDKSLVKALEELARFYGAGLHDFDVRHDEWCPLLQAARPVAELCTCDYEIVRIPKFEPGIN